jgi:transcription-repair coupling factor (superfamily II helicase)
LKGEPATERVDPVISVDVEALLPESYVPEVNQRLALYKRLAEVERAEEIADARAELTDRFGPPPPAVEALLDVLTLRVAARALGVERVEAGAGRAVLTFAASTKVTPSQVLKAIAASGGALALRKEYTVEARIPAEPWPAVRDALTKLLDSLR